MLDSLITALPESARHGILVLTVPSDRSFDEVRQFMNELSTVAETDDFDALIMCVRGGIHLDELPEYEARTLYEKLKERFA